MKRLVIFSDSLALPRNIPEITFLEDTYPYLLKEHFDVYQYSKGGGRISDLLLQTFYYNQYKPDVIIIQCGIVDCAPRAFTYNEEKFFESNYLGKFIRKLLSKTITTKTIRNLRHKSWTEERIFKKECKDFINQFPTVPIFALSILPPSYEYEISVPGISNKIEIYNKILEDIFGNHLISLNDIPEEGIMSDFHHLNKIGHNYVFDEVLTKLREYNII